MDATIIVDSGSTKAAWRAFVAKDIIFECESNGLNPLYLSEDEIVNEIDKNIKPYLGFQSIKRVYFYGAGCNTDENQMKVQNALSLFFPDSIFHINSDMEGAALGLFGNQEGIACILGTGSNACHWNGEKIISHILSLGFIIGDEGSGAWIGKQVAADFLRNRLPIEIRLHIEKQYPNDLEFFQKSIYSSNYASRFLAKLGGCIGLLPENEYTVNLYKAAFNTFYNKFISSFAQTDLEYGFIGGIATTMRSVIEQECAVLGLKVKCITHNPLNGIQNFLEKELYP